MKHNIFILGLGLMFSTTACVDLNQEPQSFLTEEQFIQQPQEIGIVQKSLDGLYNTLWFNNYGYSCRRLRLEVSAGEMVPQFSKASNPLTNVYELAPVTGSIDKDSEQLWRNFWALITGANKIIVGTPIPEGDEAATYKAAIAEAYFLRAFSYFNLVRIFGDVPAIKSSLDAINKSIQRTPVETIYNDIILPDLAYACENLPAVSRTKSSNTPSKWAAKTLLADVYITMAGWPLNKGKEYYAKAATEAKDIIDNSGLSLTPKYADLWKEAKKVSDKEHLFAVHNSVAAKNPSQFGKSFYSSDHMYGGWGDYFASPLFVETHPQDDRLANDFLTDWVMWNDVKDHKKGTYPVNYKTSINKCPLIVKFSDYNQMNSDKTSCSQLSNGITPIYRYADALLIYAEASNLAEGGPNALAKKCLKEIQDRAGYPEADRPAIGSQAEFDKAVFAERGWEFYAEGKRWFELVRREKVGEYRNKPAKEAGDKGIDVEYAMYFDSSLYKANNHYYLPLPMAEIDMTGWTNNGGY